MSYHPLFVPAVLPVRQVQPTFWYHNLDILPFVRPFGELHPDFHPSAECIKVSINLTNDQCTRNDSRLHFYSRHRLHLRIISEKQIKCIFKTQSNLILMPSLNHRNNKKIEFCYFRFSDFTWFARMVIASWSDVILSLISVYFNKLLFLCSLSPLLSFSRLFEWLFFISRGTKTPPPQSHWAQIVAPSWSSLSPSHQQKYPSCKKN